MTRPAKKDWSRWVALGLYVGSAGNPEMDWEKVAKDLYESDFNAISIHFMSPWDNEKGIYPWMFDEVTKKYDLTKPNLEYYAKVEEMLDRLAYYWIGIEIDFFDDYFDWNKWVEDMPFPYHPFRDNKFNKSLVGKSKWFYDGWIAGIGFLWVSWEDVSICKMKNYKPISPLGQPIINYIKRIMAIVKKIKTKYPGFRVRYKMFNETLAMMEDCQRGEHGCTCYYSGECVKDNPARSKGDRIELQAMVRDLWPLYIQPPMTKAVGYIDYMALYKGDPHIPTLGGAIDWIQKCGFQMEVHYAYSKKHVQDLLDAGVPQSTLFSSDGMKEPPEVHYGTGDSPYFDDLKGVESLHLRNVEYKLWARYKGPRKWRVGQMMWNWNEFFPLMKQIFS